MLLGGKCAATPSVADTERAEGLAGGSMLNFAGTGLKNLGVFGTGQTAYFSETCLHTSINWGIVTYHDILPSYWGHGEINSAANKLQ